MTTTRKTFLAATLAGAALLSGCATYYDPYGYGYGYDNRYYGGSTYYDPYYAGPTIGFGYTYYERDGRRYYRDRDGREWDRDRDARRTDGQRPWRDRDNDNRPDPVAPDGVNRGGDLGTGRDPRANPNNSPG